MFINTEIFKQPSLKIFIINIFFSKISRKIKGIRNKNIIKRFKKAKCIVDVLLILYNPFFDFISMFCLDDEYLKRNYNYYANLSPFIQKVNTILLYFSAKSY